MLRTNTLPEQMMEFHTLPQFGEFTQFIKYKKMLQILRSFNNSEKKLTSSKSYYEIK